MSVSITIRNVPEEVRNELAARSARSGRSLQEYLSLQLSALATRPDPDDALTSIRANARTYPQVAASEIISDIDADRQ